MKTAQQLESRNEEFMNFTDEDLFEIELEDIKNCEFEPIPIYRNKKEIKMKRNKNNELKQEILTYTLLILTAIIGWAAIDMKMNSMKNYAKNNNCHWHEVDREAICK